MALMALGYVAPLASNAAGSLCDKQGSFVGLQNYLDVFTSYYFLDSLAFTLKVSLTATAISMAVAIVVALALRETFVGKKLVVLLFQFNLTVPRMAAAMMVMLLLSQTGMVSQACVALGITDSASEFPWFVHDAGGWGIIAAFAWKFFPYIGMSTLGILQGASVEYEHQAAVLGVGPFRRFWHVTLPLIIPATSIASIIVFSAAFGDYEPSHDPGVFQPPRPFGRDVREVHRRHDDGQAPGVRADDSHDGRARHRHPRLPAPHHEGGGRKWVGPCAAW